MSLAPPFLFTCILIFVLFHNKITQGSAAKGVDASEPAYTISVSTSGQANYTTIQAAIDSIPSNNNQWVHILVSSDTYREKVNVPANKPYIFLEGNGNTIISWDAHTAADHSATFSTAAENFVAKNIIFINTYRNVGQQKDPEQSVTVMVTGDKTSFYGCSFYGFQDTLLDSTGRHYFKNCLIEGSIDFIWGSGQSIYEECKISVIPISGGKQAGFITAQGRNSDAEKNGFVFKGGSVIRNEKAITYLGRAYGGYSRVIWYQTDFCDGIVPLGWDAWNHADHVENLEYAEVDCNGSGSDLSKRVPWLKKLNNVRKFTDISYIDEDGWLENQPIS